MKLNTKVRYGVRTMIEIAMNANQKGLLQKEIAERQNIPLKFLDKIISDLKSNNLIINVSGKSSGYILAMKSSQITVLDIYEASEGKIRLINCISGQTACCKNHSCASQELWTDLNSALENKLNTVTLEYLAERQQELDTLKQNNINFDI